MKLRKDMMAKKLTWNAAVLLGAVCVMAGAPQARIYVDSGATGAGSGSSWVDAFTDLQDALDVAGSGDSIWIAKGTYYPDRGTLHPDSLFRITADLTLLGGFAGGETDAAQSDPTANPTVLSGDIDRNDEISATGGIVSNTEGNTKRIMTVDCDGACLIDGFTFTGSSALYFWGYNKPSMQVRVTRCSFVNIQPANAFDFHVISGSGQVDFEECLFENNRCEHATVELFESYSYFAFTRCVFRNNRTPRSGGAINAEINGTLGLYECVFEGNSAYRGGAVWLRWYSTVVEENAVTVRNCLFAGNSAESEAAAIYNSRMNLAVTNCTFVDNLASPDTANVLSAKDGSETSIVNSIVWGNGASAENSVSITSSTVSWSHSNLQGSGGSGAGWDGTYGADLGGNTDLEPTFVGAGEYPHALYQGSHGIDLGDPATDTTGGGEDLAGQSRIRDGRIDMGAYEHHPQPRRFHVDSANGNPGDGTSWDAAFTDLNDALEIAAFGDTVWVARGTYFPDRGTGERTSSYTLLRGVYLFGGFAGDETTLAQREVPARGTILSGDIGVRGDMTDNSLRIMVGSPEFAVDGFRFYQGGATRVGEGVNGGALYVDRAERIMIANCRFEENRCEDGGGALWLSVVTDAVIDACAFVNNRIAGENTYRGAAINLAATNLRMTNSLFVGHNDEPIRADEASMSLTNCTFYANDGQFTVTTPSVHAYLCDIEFVNCIFWSDTAGNGDYEIMVDTSTLVMDYCDVRRGTGGIHPSRTNAVIENITNTAPSFADTAAGDYSLVPGSHGTDAGDPATDTTGWGRDLAGRLRIVNDRIDLGAYETPAPPAPPSPPELLAALDQLSVAAGDTIRIDVTAADTAGNGLYVRWSSGAIADLVWQADASPEGVVVSFDPATHSLRIMPGPAYLPGAVFSVTLRTFDPADATLFDTRVSRIEVRAPGFDLRDVSIVQGDNGTFDGAMEAAGNAWPLKFSQNRLYLFEGQVRSDGTPDRDAMAYLTGIEVTEVSAPASRDGAREYGRYTFAFHPQQVLVYDADGIWSGNNLRDWARNNPEFRRSNTLAFVLPVATDYDEVHFHVVKVPADFDGPDIRLWVAEVDSESVSLAWDLGGDAAIVDSLVLYLNPLGDGSPSPDTLDLGHLLPDGTTLRSRGLQDSREYEIFLAARDTRDNWGTAVVRATTDSRHYTISGTVTGPFEPAVDGGEVVLSRLEEKTTAFGVRRIEEKELQTVALEEDHTYRFEGVVNGDRYAVYPRLADYYAAPPVRPVIVSRSDVAGIDFALDPTPLLRPGDVTVRQLEGTGDLQITARVDSVFENEEPHTVTLRWEAGYSDGAVVDEQEFVIGDYDAMPGAEGAVTWSFVLTRHEIDSAILSRTGSFDEYVRYVDARLATRTPRFSPFRVGTWSYPLPEGDHVLFAPQWFRSPAKPFISRPMPKADDLFFRVRNGSPGLGVEAHAIVTNVDDPGETHERTLDVSHATASTTIGRQTWILRRLEWRYNAASTVDADGVQFLSGVVPGSDGVRVPAGKFAPGGAESTAPDPAAARISFQVYASEAVKVLPWVLAERAVTENAFVYVGANGVLNQASGSRALLKSGQKPGWLPMFTRYPAEEQFLHLVKGLNTIDLYVGSTEIALSAVALRLPGRGFWWTEEPPADRSLHQVAGLANRARRAHGFGLTPDTDYRLAVVLRDRFGNVSDTVSWEFRTQDPQFMGNVIASQDTGSGDLLLSIRPTPEQLVPGSYLDSVSLRLEDGREAKIDLPNQGFDGPNIWKDIRITREQLAGELLEEADFIRRARYRAAGIVVSRDSVDTAIVCYYKWVHRGIHTGEMAGECPDCSYWTSLSCSTATTYTPHTTSVTYDFDWPATPGFVSSQQYGPVAGPALSARLREPYRIVLDTINPNLGQDGTARQQMAGKLVATWKPGSLCDDSTTMEYPFGNRFTMNDDGWIAFRPSFEAAQRTVVGSWRNEGAANDGARHQWLDTYEGGAATIGGFLPNTGDSVKTIELAGPPLETVPSISMGIFLGDDQASGDGSDAEKFRLWVMPASDNGETSDEFYWGVDSVPLAGAPGSASPSDAGPNGWVEGPLVTLTPGNHSIDLFMREDGTRVIGIALSKVDKTEPAAAAEELPTWGDAGFDVEVVADKLPADRQIAFRVRAEDRFGNVSSEAQDEFLTLKPVDNVPTLVFEPESEILGGFFATGTPAVVVRAERYYEGEFAAPECVLLSIDGGTVDTISAVLEVEALSAESWRVVVAEGQSLPNHPTAAELGPDNRYLLLARAVSAAGAPGPWGAFAFGVDDATPSAGVELSDSSFTYGGILFRYLYGTGEGSAIRGDLVVIFDDDLAVSQGTDLVLEGARIELDETVDTITGIAGGQFKAYTYGEEEIVSGSDTRFSMAYGKYTVHAVTDAMVLNAVDTTIDAYEIYIEDDLGTPGRMTRTPAGAATFVPVPIVSAGIVRDETADFYVPEDDFVLRDVVYYERGTAGFSIRSCLTQFSRSEDLSTYDLVAAGSCESCGPFLVFDVVNPSYDAVAFSASDKLDRPVPVRYTLDNHDYDLMGRSYTVAPSAIDTVRYDGWRLDIESYAFDAAGVRLTDFAVQVDRETFPVRNDTLTMPHSTSAIPHATQDTVIQLNPNGRYIRNFAGVAVRGETGVDRGALHFYGTADAVNAEGVALTSTDRYVVTNVPTYRFSGDGSGGAFTIEALGGEIIAPSQYQTAFRFINYPAGSNVVVPIGELVMNNRGVARVSAARNITAFAGGFMPSSGGGYAPALVLRGTMRLGHTGRLFEVEIEPLSDQPYLIVQKTFFQEQDGGYETVEVDGARIKFRSDFSLFAVGGHGRFDAPRYLNPDNAPFVRYTTENGFDLELSGDSVLVRFADPALQIVGADVLGLSSEDGLHQTHSAVFDLWRKLVHTSATVTVPPEKQCQSGVPGFAATVAEAVGDVCVTSMNLGYRGGAEQKVLLGAKARLTLGSMFKIIGMQGEVLTVDELGVGLAAGGGANPVVTLDRLLIKGDPTPRKIGVSEAAITGNPDKSQEDFIELVSAGNGIELDYRRNADSDKGETGPASFAVTFRDWTLRTTEHFPIEGLKDFAVHLDRLVYRKEGDGKGRISDLEARASYYFRELPLFGDLCLENVTVMVGADGVADQRIDFVNDDEANQEQRPELQGYFAVRFGAFRFGDRRLDTQCDGERSGFKIYFNGDIEGDFCFKYYEDIPIYPQEPIGDETRVYITGSESDANGTFIKFRTRYVKEGSKRSFIASVLGAKVVSSKPISPMENPIDVTLEEATVEVSEGSVKLKTLATTLDIDRQLQKGPFTLSLQSVSLGVVDGFPEELFERADGYETLKGTADPVFYVRFAAGVEFAAKDENDKGCGFDGQVNIAFANRLHANDELVINWDVKGDVDCSIALVDVSARNIHIQKDQVNIGVIHVDLSRLKSILERDRSHVPDADALASAAKVGFEFGSDEDRYGVIMQNLHWDFGGELTVGKVTPLFATSIKFSVAGIELFADADFSPLFDTESPGIYFDNVRLKLNEALGGAEISTGFGVLINGRSPYVHPQPGKNATFRFALPSLEITKDIRIGNAEMEIGIDEDPATGYREWYCRGKASMNVPGLFDEVGVDLALTQRNPKDNVTGIRHCKLWIKLAPATRIPLGTTPFYISGFFGALYDGLGMPEGAIACNVPTLPPGLKFEAKMYLEFKEPQTLNGDLGLWVQLTALNFGIDGNLKALEGIVTANACAALYNNGRNFHGELGVHARVKITVDGEFIVDIWRDNTGPNLSGEANARIGIPRATFVDRRWLKIPRKGRSFGLFTNFGKFANEQKGFTTGIKIIGRRFGLGIIGRRFKIGNMSKHRLKKPNSPVTTGIKLEGGELVTVVVAKSHELADFQWTDQIGRFMALGGSYLPYENYQDPVDYDPSLYIDADEVNLGDDAELNWIARSWANVPDGNGQVYDDSLYVYLPPYDDGQELAFDYSLFATLVDPVLDMEVDTVREDDSVKVVFRGSIERFYDEIERRALFDGEVQDTVLKQRMRLKLFYREDFSENEKYGRPKTIGSWIEIPARQLEGRPDASGDRLVFTDVKWPVKHGTPGKLEFGVAVEFVDFLIQNDDGAKVVLPDENEEDAMVFTTEPTAIPDAAGAQFVVPVTAEQLPEVQAPVKFTVTGSPLEENWTGEDESRSLFLRWQDVDVPSLAGYEVVWSSTGSSNKYRSIVGPDGSYTIVFPEPALYTENCDDVHDTLVVNAEGDTLEYSLATACGQFYDPELQRTVRPYQADIFDTEWNVTVFPIVERDTIEEVPYGGTRMDGTVDDTTITRSRKVFERVEGKEVSVTGVNLGERTGVDDGRNKFLLSFLSDGAPIGAGDVIDVPLGGRADAELALEIADHDTAGAHPANYADLYARVVEVTGAEDDIIAPAERNYPGVGLQSSRLAIGADRETFSLSFTPRTETKTCRELFAEGCPDCDEPVREEESVCGELADSVFVERSPLGVYKTYFYAINNGYRGLPVPDETAAHAVYDSLVFRVTPPVPVLHDVGEPFLIPNRAGQTLTLRTSRLWWHDASGAEPRIKLLVDDGAGKTVVKDDFTPTYRQVAPEDTGAGTWLVTDTFTLVTAHEGNRFHVVIENVHPLGAEELVTASDTFSLINIHNPHEIGCRGYDLAETADNYDYAMDFIGNYPTIFSPGEKMTVFVSNLLVTDPTFYQVRMWRNGELFRQIDSFEVANHGIEFRVPEDVPVDDGAEWTVITTLSDALGIDSCDQAVWGEGQILRAMGDRTYEIRGTSRGFVIARADGDEEHLDLDEIWYTLGADSGEYPPPTDYYPHNPPLERKLPNSCWVTAYVRTASTGDDRDTLQAYVLIGSTPRLVDGDGRPLGDDPLTPGMIIGIDNPSGPTNRQPTNPVYIRYYWFADGNRRLVDGPIVVGPHDDCPLTIETWEIRSDGGGYDTLLNNVYVHECVIEEQTPGTIVSIPSSQLLYATAHPVERYPLLVRLDSTNFDDWAAAETDGVYFRDMNGTPLPSQTETADFAGRSLEAWVRMPRLDPGTGTNFIEVVTGTPPAATASTDVWRGTYSAVWHHGEGAGGTVDAAGGHDAATSGTVSRVGGPVGEALDYTGGFAEVAAGGPGSVNDPALTLSAWVWINDPGALAHQGTPVCGRGLDTPEHAVGLLAADDGSIALVVGADTLRSATGVTEGGTWLLLAGTYNRFADGTNAYLYVNGIQVAAGRLHNDARLPYETGTGYVIAPATFPGRIDEARVSPHALPPSWLALDYHSQRPSADFLRPRPGHVEIAAPGRPAFRIRTDWMGDSLAFTDRTDWRVFAADPVFHSQALVSTRYADRLSRADTLVAFSVAGPVTLSLCIDARYDIEPPFLADWTATGKQVLLLRTDAAHNEVVPLNVYRMAVGGAGTIGIPGPVAGTAGNEHVVPYLVFVDGLSPRAEVHVEADSPHGTHVVAHADTGIFLYRDREYRIDSLPESLRGGVLVAPPNADKHATASSWLAARAGSMVEAYLMLDSRYDTLPTLVPTQGWNPTGMRATTTAGAERFHIFSRRFAAGAIEVPGPRSGGARGNALSPALILRRDTLEALVRVPSGYGITILDTNVQLYTDSAWRVTHVSGSLRGFYLVQTPQAAYDDALLERATMTLLRSAWVYVAVDRNQTALPRFMTGFDESGGWREVSSVLMTDAPSKYRIYRKYLPAGDLPLDGARSSGETNNRFNYVILVDPVRYRAPVEIDPAYPVTPDVARGDTLFSGGEEIIIDVHERLVGQDLVHVPRVAVECRELRLDLQGPALVTVGVSSEYDPARTFLVRDGWRRAEGELVISGNLPVFDLWEKEVEAGSVVIPGILCDSLTGTALNTPVFIDHRPPAYRGYHATDLQVRGFGNGRRASSESYAVRNLDVSFAAAYGLQSRSWRMNVRARGGSVRTDTLRVLAPRADTSSIVRRRGAGDTVIVVVDNSLFLADLMPVLVNADSVRVDAVTLATEGAVRVTFANPTENAVTDEFALVLFEDRDGDYEYSSAVDHLVGRVLVNGIEPYEYRMYEIALDDDLSFPGSIIFAFVDADRWIDELDERNNVVSSGTACDEYEPYEYTTDYHWRSDSAVAAGVPVGAQVVACRIADTDGDTAITDQDSVCVLYVGGYQLHAVKAGTGDTLFAPRYIDGFANTDIAVYDMDADGRPEITVGSVVYDTAGALWWDASDTLAALPARTVDIDRDGVADSVTVDSGCVVVRSGSDSLVLYVSELGRWTGEQDEITVGVLAHVVPAPFKCYDPNLSFPRYSLISSGVTPEGEAVDTVELTVRLGNAGAEDLPAGMEIVVTAIDTGGVATVVGAGMNSGVLIAGEYEDIPVHAVVGSGAVASVRFETDIRNRYFERSEANNEVELGL